VTREAAWLAVIVAVALALILVGITWGLPSAWSWSNDDITPKMPLSIPAIWQGGTHPYPYLQAWLDRALYVPYLARLRGRGELRVDCEDLTKARCYRDPHRALGALILLGRLLSAAMGVGIVLAVYAAARLAFADVLAARLAALVAAVTQVLVFHAHLGNVDTPVTFWFALSLVPYVRLFRRGQVRDHVLLGLLSGAALATKESVVGAHVLMILAVAVAGVRRARSAPASASGRRGAAGYLGRRWAALAVGYAGVYVVANNVLLNPTGYAEHFRFWIGGRGISGWNASYTGQLPLLGTSALRLVDAMGLPLVVLSMVGVLWSLARHRVAWWLLVPGVSYYVITIALVRYVYVRFTMPIVVVLAVFGGLLAADLWRLGGRARVLGRVAVALAVVYGLLYSVQSDLLMVRDARYAAESWIQRVIPADATVEVVGSKTYLPRLDYLGYGDERIPWEELSDAGLARRAPEFIVVSSKSAASAAAQVRPFLADLLAGRAGYAVVFDHRTASPLAGILGTHYADSRVNPRVIVLRRGR
jgi:hypothetical protein